MSNVAELERALDYPWEKWTVFLHPAQRDLVERQYNGPARVSGSAGTGKTVVALHRAAYLAKQHPEARLLLTTFSETLSKSLRSKIRRLVGNHPRVYERIEVYAIGALGRRLYAGRFGRPNIVEDSTLREILIDAANEVEAHRFSEQFIWTEWTQIVAAWQLDSWDAYRDVQRLGRKTRLGEKQRRLLWAIFQRVLSVLADQDLLTPASLFARLTRHLDEGGSLPYDFAIVDAS